MKITEDLFRPILVTKGRKTGKEHGVMLRAVNHNGKIYFSRHRPDGDWFQNAIANPQVKIQYNDTMFTGQAKLVEDEELSRKISELKKQQFHGQKTVDFGVPIVMEKMSIFQKDAHKRLLSKWTQAFS